MSNRINWKIYNFYVVCALQVLDLISSDNLNVPSEEEVYRAVLSWVKHDIDGRRQHVPRVSVFLLVKHTLYSYSTLCRFSVYLSTYINYFKLLNYPFSGSSLLPPCLLQSYTLGNNLLQLMKCVRLPLLTRDFLMSNVDTELLVRHHSECKDLLIEALKYHLMPEQRGVLSNCRTRPRRCEGASPVLFAVGQYNKI